MHRRRPFLCMTLSTKDLFLYCYSLYPSIIRLNSSAVEGGV